MINYPHFNFYPGQSTQYLQGSKGRLFVIFGHVTFFKRIKEYAFKKGDTFLIQEMWYKHLVEEPFFKDVIQSGINPENIYITTDSDYTTEEKEKSPVPLEKYRYIPHNIFVSPKKSFPMGRPKDFDFVINGRNKSYKRLELASKVPNIHLLSNMNMEDNLPYPTVIPRRLSLNEVPKYLNRCKIGLILSSKEGGCYASGEYLMNGLPVISTKSLGGREYQYTDYNSIICGDSPEEVKEACLEMRSRYDKGDVEPHKIFQECNEINDPFKEKFLILLKEIFDVIGLEDSKDTIKKDILETDHFGAVL